ncbi:peroxiredoxin family protein [Granulicella pectinivorans]|uniref:peroxiredoxin family protein n=1 Tax=Granulicella pectinivorans TaxID=474950 RepID=UPI001587A8C5|nr:TlpA disulfide reductase family protein [Granulicella pectinivorans]
MRIASRSTALAFVFAALSTSASVAQSNHASLPIDGRWDASLVNNGPAVPFRLDIDGSGPTLKGTFYDGFKPYEGTTSATYQNGVLTLKAEHYLTTITASLKDDKLAGDVLLQGPNFHIKYGFEAKRHQDAATKAENVPSIAGVWELPLESPSAKGEKSFHLIVRQNGADAEASILRIDGDTGAYSGTYKDGRWVLSHFDGSRPGVIEVAAKSDGTLDVIQHNEALKKAIEGDSPETKTAANGGYGGAPVEAVTGDRLIAYRPEVARAKGLPEPDNFNTHTTVRNANEKFTFNFPDANGKLISSDDPRFKGKVVVAVVTGTWCPNCHDEARFLVQLDKKYRDKGLAIVALDFEEPEEQGTLTRERAFVKEYGVNYTYLIAGAPSEMWEKVPQAVNLNTWPATIFVGRDGLVKGIHSGFASQASGEFNSQLQQEFTAKIEKLLAEHATTQNAAVEAPSLKH